MVRSPCLDKGMQVSRIIYSGAGGEVLWYQTKVILRHLGGDGQQWKEGPFLAKVTTGGAGKIMSLGYILLKC
jgi:hypothetical protein